MRHFGPENRTVELMCNIIVLSELGLTGKLAQRVYPGLPITQECKIVCVVILE
jgi:hypothetical protein